MFGIAKFRIRCTIIWYRLVKIYLAIPKAY